MLSNISRYIRCCKDYTILSCWLYVFLVVLCHVKWFSDLLYPSNQFGGNWFSSFCVILLINKATERYRVKQEMFRYHFSLRNRFRYRSDTSGVQKLKPLQLLTLFGSDGCIIIKCCKWHHRCHPLKLVFILLVELVLSGEEEVISRKRELQFYQDETNIL